LTVTVTSASEAAAAACRHLCLPRGMPRGRGISAERQRHLCLPRGPPERCRASRDLGSAGCVGAGCVGAGGGQAAFNTAALPVAVQRPLAAARTGRSAHHLLAPPIICWLRPSSAGVVELLRLARRSSTAISDMGQGISTLRHRQGTGHQHSPTRGSDLGREWDSFSGRTSRPGVSSRLPPSRPGCLLRVQAASFASRRTRTRGRESARAGSGTGRAACGRPGASATGPVNYMGVSPMSALVSISCAAGGYIL
jgi:hypothetical protein